MTSMRNQAQLINFITKWALTNALCWSIAIPFSFLIVNGWILQPFAFFDLYRCSAVDIPERPQIFIENFCSQSWFALCFTIGGILIGSLIGFAQRYLLRNRHEVAVKWRNANIDGIILGFLFTYPIIILSQFIGSQPYRILEHLPPIPEGALVGVCTISLTMGEIISGFFESRSLNLCSSKARNWQLINLVIFLLVMIIGIQLFPIVVNWLEDTTTMTLYLNNKLYSMIIVGLLSGFIAGILQGHQLFRTIFVIRRST